MGTPHKHAALIKAWADGAEIQFRRECNARWEDCSDPPGWYYSFQYRVKPQVAKYRRYLGTYPTFTDPLGQKTKVFVLHEGEQLSAAQMADTFFIRWIDHDWQEVEL